MPPARFGLCDRCAHQKLVRSGRGSVFSMCRIGLADPDWPKYPPMPVTGCPRFEPAAPAEPPPDPRTDPPAAR
jgi:hypothetical protein